jgi:hypothetical protein
VKSYLYTQNKNNATNREGRQHSQRGICANHTNTIGNYIYINTHAATKWIQTQR